MKRQFVHVAQDAIRSNVKNGTDDPALILNEGGKPARVKKIEIRLHDGTLVGTFVQDMSNPKSCGARIWFDVNKEVARASGL